MSQFFNQGFLKAQYFNANYLTGAQEKSSGWRRLIISQLQEASLKADEERKKALTEVKSDAVDSSKEEVVKVRRPKTRRRTTPDIAPEQEVAAEILRAAPLPPYRPPAKTDVDVPPWLLIAQTELSGLWVKLGVAPSVFQEFGLEAANVLLEEEQETEQEEDLLFLLSML